ncbi:peroxide stress protein YaaA [Litorivivens sp.]|uniref:peroxide stress protein YaaA n=1 Tax=Litorivivens sp. TaxID=2020868 RepID=UPI003562DA33
MLTVISPAKTLDFESPLPTQEHTQPDFLEQSQQLVDELRSLSPDDISSLMKISPALGELNHQRFMNWSTPFTPDNARPAVLAFKGDVYQGLDPQQFGKRDFAFAQKHLRILSGLYGLLRPLDLIQPYRLEMGTRFANSKGKDLYAFWDQQITEAVNEALGEAKTETLINLASNEYFKSVKKKTLNANIVTPIFKDQKNGQYKIISFYAKKARGLMSAYIIKNRVKSVEELKAFDWEGYSYQAKQSSASELVFTRKEQA